MKILIIDIETTGFSKTKNTIVEIGLVELDLSTGEIEIIFDKVVHEKTATPSEIKNSWIVENGFMTYDEIANSEPLEVYNDEIQNLINLYSLGATAFNNSFDFGFLEERGFMFQKKLGCPMRLSRNIVKAENKLGRIKNPNVQEAYQYFFGETEYIEKHRGADDAYHEARIVFELFKLGIFKID
jgi:DNA polymerase III epsilon subunit-like protein